MQSKKKFFTKKRVIWAVIILLVAFCIVYAVLPKSNAKNIITEFVKKDNLKQTVLATGQVVSNTDLELSFNSTGVLKGLKVVVGDKVKKNDILGTLDQKNELANLTSARGDLAQARASYRKIIDGASNEDINLTEKAVQSAQVALDSAKSSLENTKLGQDVLVKNAYGALLNSSLAAIPDQSNTAASNPIITGTYIGNEEGKYTLTVYNSSSGGYISLSGLEMGTAPVNSTAPVALGTHGLYVQFPTSFSINTTNIWTVSIPNTSASTYLTNLNIYNSALETRRMAIKTAEDTVASAEANLNQQNSALELKKAAARPAEVELAQAQILSAEGRVESAQASLENTILRAPALGTITKIDIKLGEQAQALKGVMVLQDISSLYLEANINEANISGIMIDQPVDVTFDAFGVDKIYQAKIKKIDPASTIISGVVNYKITAELGLIPEIRPGMTANMTILVKEKDDVLVVPSRAVLDGDTGKIVRLITNTKKKTYKEVPVETGLLGDSGMAEIISGLKEGDEIVTIINK